MEAVVAEKLTDYFNENPDAFRKIVQKIFDAAAARIAAKKARELTRRKGALEFAGLTRKDGRLPRKGSRSMRTVSGRGDSAGGSQRWRGDRRTQAVLPLRGKI